MQVGVEGRFSWDAWEGRECLRKMRLINGGPPSSAHFLSAYSVWKDFSLDVDKQIKCVSMNIGKVTMNYRLNDDVTERGRGIRREGGTFRNHNV